MSETGTYRVSGMHCGHCVAAVTREVMAIPGIDSVHVELEDGTVVVVGERVERAAVAAAIEEAGYDLLDD